ncbi:MAG: TetR/AcrR family transcriptional regulator [Chloroflexota bacterium]
MDYALELGRRERKRQAIHESLLQAAQALFAQQGVNRTTVDDIAEAADVSRQTVFNHFPYKEAFALELAAETLRRVGDQARAQLESEVPAIDVLGRVSERLLDQAIQQGEQIVVVAQELLHPDQERAERAAERVPLKELFEAILIQAREEGSVRGDLPLEIVSNRLSANFATIVGQVMNCDPEGLHRELAICFEIVLNGISERRN